MTRALLASVVVVLAFEGAAGAQGMDPNDISIASFNPDAAVAPVSAIQGPGIKVGEGTVIHPVVGLETGVVSNVFFQPNDPQSAGILRFLAQVGTGSLPRERLSLGPDSDEDINQGSFQYRADLRATYDQMLSSDDTVTDTGGLGLGATFRGLANPMGRVAFGVTEDFMRLIRAANWETDANTNRILNNLQLKVVYQPRDRAIGGYLYYRNTLDIFERSQQRFANRMFNRIGVHPVWRWLPQTQLYLDVSWEVVNQIGAASIPEEEKPTSYPLRALAGISTLLTLKTTFNVYAGYTNGFYSSGPSFSAPILGGSIGYRYSPRGRAQLMYSWMHEDSINANYYRDHVVQLLVQQLFVPFVVMVQPEIHFREYNGVRLVDGPPTRNDVILAAVAGIQYNFRNWIAAALSYRLSSVDTDFRYMNLGGGVLTDPSYTRHDLMFGVRAAL